MKVDQHVRRKKKNNLAFKWKNPKQKAKQNDQ